VKRYIGTKVIMAEEGPAPQDEDDLSDVTLGMKVVDADGHESWVPFDVFEEAYRPCDNLPFGLAIEALKLGHKVARTGWPSRGKWLELQNPDGNSKMTLPYIYINYPDDAVNTPGARVPWLASQTDVLADDWYLV